MLANLEPEIRRTILSACNLEKHTDNTITDPERLDASLEEIRQQGFSINNQEDSVGLIAMAVPVHDAQNQVVAGLAVHAPMARLSIPDAKRLLPKFSEAATKIGNALFY